MDFSKLDELLEERYEHDIQDFTEEDYQNDETFGGPADVSPTTPGDVLDFSAPLPPRETTSSGQALKVTTLQDIEAQLMKTHSQPTFPSNRVNAPQMLSAQDVEMMLQMQTGMISPAMFSPNPISPPMVSPMTLPSPSIFSPVFPSPSMNTAGFPLPSTIAPQSIPSSVQPRPLSRNKADSAKSSPTEPIPVPPLAAKESSESLIVTVRKYIYLNL